MRKKYQKHIKLILTLYQKSDKIYIVKEVKMKRLCIQLELKLIEELKKEAKENHQTLSAYIRSILWKRSK